MLYIDSDFSHCFHRAVRFFFFFTLISMVRNEIVMKSSSCLAASETLPSHLGDAICMEKYCISRSGYPPNLTKCCGFHDKYKAPSPPNIAPLLFYSFLDPILYTILFSIQYSTLLFSSLLFLHCTILYSSNLYSSILFYSLLFSSILCSSFLFSTILYSSILFYSRLLFSLPYYSFSSILYSPI